MIVQYDARGFIGHVMNTYPPAAANALRAAGALFLECDPPGWSVIGEGYVEGGALRRRPALSPMVSKTAIAADDADEAVISGLPDPCTVTIDLGGESPLSRDVSGGVLALTSPMPATYRIDVDHWPFLPWSVEIVAG